MEPVMTTWTSKSSCSFGSKGLTAATFVDHLSQRTKASLGRFLGACVLTCAWEAKQPPTTVVSQPLLKYPDLPKPSNQRMLLKPYAESGYDLRAILELRGFGGSG